MQSQQPSTSNQVELIPAQTIPTSLVETPQDLLELYKTCFAMQKLCIREMGVGLSAVQVGIPWRVFVANLGEFRYFVDCQYSPLDENKTDSLEGCLSLRYNGRARQFLVKRFTNIKLCGFELISKDKLLLQPIEETHSGFQAIVLQHECDHHNGILISHIGSEIELNRPLGV